MKDILLWLVHVPKTGGMSLIEYLHAGVRGKEFFAYQHGHDRYSKAMENKLLKKSKHIIKFTALRDPVKHSASLYSYTKTNKSHYAHSLAINNNFNDWLDLFSEVPNYYVKFFSSFESPNYKLALRQLKKFDFILNTETLTNDFNNMLITVGLPGVFDTHINSFEKPTIIPESVEKIKRIRNLDYKLLEEINFQGRI